MISLVTGTVFAKSTSAVVLVVNGVGFDIAVPASVARNCNVGDALSLHTRLVVREDSLALFGFLGEEDRSAFDQLCSVNGVGPKLALTVLSQLGHRELAAAVANQNEALLRSISGIGPKTAKLILLSLAGSAKSGSKLIDALVALGVAPKAAADALQRVDQQADEATQLKQALAIIGEGKLS